MTNRPFDLIVFDVDGTLVDAFQDITDAVNAALAQWGRPPKSKKRVIECVGHGVRWLMEQIIGNDDVPLDEALAFMRDYYQEHPARTAELYPGVAATLAQLDAAGIRLAVLSNKVEAITRKLLEMLGVADHLDRIVGETERYPRKPAPDGLLALAAKLDAAPARTLMVGDNDTDCDVAANAGCAFCAVTYGAKDRAHWEARGVAYVIDHFEELTRITEI